MTICVYVDVLSAVSCSAPLILVCHISLVSHLYGALQLPVDWHAERHEVAELALSMQDISTNILALYGQHGMGKTLLAVSLASELVNNGHWTAAYYVDMQGITNHVVAGKCVMLHVAPVRCMTNLSICRAFHL